MFLAGSLVAVALILMSLVLVAKTRAEHFDQQTRLEKHRKKLAERSSSGEAESIFADSRTGYLANLLSLAGLESKYDTMKSRWIMSAVVTEVLLVIITFLFVKDLVVIAALLGLPVGATLFIVYLKYIAKQRQDKLTEQLPQILETMVSSLKAGSPVTDIFRIISETGPVPIKDEFKRALVTLQLGKSIREVMLDMTKRIRTPDFKLLAQAIFISQDTGANLSEVVTVIAESLRERFKLRDYMNSLTAQGKVTALFIGLLPYGMTALIAIAAPGYMNPFLNNPLARLIFIALIVWEMLGFAILMKLTTFEV